MVVSIVIVIRISVVPRRAANMVVVIIMIMPATANADKKSRDNSKSQHRTTDALTTKGHKEAIHDRTFR